MTFDDESLHLGYSDESYYNASHRYRAISLLTCDYSTGEHLRNELNGKLKRYNVSELKWGKMNSDKYYRCATEALDLIFDYLPENCLRIDTIIWDSYDCTPRLGKATIFELMYYQLFENVFKRRWIGALGWKLFPDTQGSIDWKKIEEILNKVLDPMQVQVKEIDSGKEVLSQIPDIFGGLAAFSKRDYTKYKARHGTLDAWMSDDAGIDKKRDQKAKLTGREYYRFRLLEKFNKCCKECKLGVSFENANGLWTPNPKKPINFWNFKPDPKETTRQVQIEEVENANT